MPHASSCPTRCIPPALHSHVPHPPTPLQAAVEEGIVTGGGCTLLRLSNMVDAFKATLTDDEQKVGVGGWW